ncbi:MAG: S-layer homology domain-containing protein [Ruminiclostridium sp.]|nr:S-layer homology domain-containing protein [Ruminiclostridium sp.]
MKRLITLLLSLTLALGLLTVPAGAVSTQEAQDSAQLLYNMELFKGIGDNPDGTPNFDLNNSLTRDQAVTMLVRLLGKENEALAKNYSSPFTDLQGWAKPYVGYAYRMGLTNGISDTQFGAKSTATVAQYLTFILRALGYQDGVDFSWQRPWELTDYLGVTHGEYNAGTIQFLRGDAAFLSASALYAPLKGTNQTLLIYLANQGALGGDTVVVWNYGHLDIKENFASFLFYPVKGSPASFKSFHLDKVTVNTLGCSTLQLNTTEEVSKYLASIGEDASGFGYVEITYNQQAAIDAATDFLNDPNTGEVHPIVTYTFQYTAVENNGNTISGTLFYPVYF